MKTMNLFMTLLVLIFASIVQVSALSPVACTQEAKLCSDGKTWVSREAPNCDFKECPINDDEYFCTSEYAPVCGEILTNSCPDGAYCLVPEKLVQKTYGNKCELGKANAKFLYEGECKTDDIGLCPEVMPPYCENGNYYTASKKIVNGCEIVEYKCEKDYELSDSLKKRIDEVIGNFETKLDNKYINDSDKVSHIDKIIGKLEDKLSEEIERSKKIIAVIKYLILKLEEVKNNYSDNDIDDIIDLLK